MKPLTDKKCCLYRIVNKVNGNDYIGISVKPKKRWLHHCYDSRNGSTTPLHRAIRKYGRDSFKVEVICWVSNYINACLLEKIAIHCGLGYYNLTKGGEGLCGINISDETRAKMRAARIATLKRKNPLYAEKEKKPKSPSKTGRRSPRGPRIPKDWEETLEIERQWMATLNLEE